MMQSDGSFVTSIAIGIANPLARLGQLVLDPRP